MAEICITQICVDPPASAGCVIGCSADVVVSDVVSNPDCIIGCSADTTVIVVVDDSCKCIPVIEYIGGTLDETCPAIGDTLNYLVTGCNCTEPACCGEAGYRWKHKPDWATNNTVCIDGNIMSIGPIKALGKIAVTLECGPKPECEECDPSEIMITITDEVRQYIDDCTVDTLLSALAAKNGTTAPLTTADPGSLSDDEVAAIGGAVGEAVVDTTTRVASVKD